MCSRWACGAGENSVPGLIVSSFDMSLLLCRCVVYRLMTVYTAALLLEPIEGVLAIATPRPSDLRHEVLYTASVSTSSKTDHREAS